jgi:hypothetical protein
VGTALARFNRSASSRRTGQLMCLLGDPKVRVSIEAQAPVARRSAPRNGAYEEEGRQLAFLAAYLDVMGRTKETEALHSAARNAIAECQQSAWSGLPIALDHSGPTLRQAVLEWLCKLGTIPAYHWMTFADLVSAKDSGTRCFACGQSVQELSFRLRVVAAGSRNMHICPRCGLIEDRPAKMRRIGLTIEEEMACLHRSLPRGGWAGLLLFRPHVGRHKSRLWPADKDGKPLPGAAIFDPGEPRGAGQMQLYMMEGASLSFARAVYLPRLDRRAGGRGRAV